MRTNTCVPAIGIKYYRVQVVQPLRIFFYEFHREFLIIRRIRMKHNDNYYIFSVGVGNISLEIEFLVRRRIISIVR